MPGSRHISPARLIARLDECFARNDLPAADRLLSSYEREARAYGDMSGLLSVLNERLGLYRRTGDRDAALSAVSEATALSEQMGISRRVSGATVLINAATTLKAFGFARESLSYYEKAEQVISAQGDRSAYTYAALLNNKGSALCELCRFPEAEDCYLRAIALLSSPGGHAGEMAVSFVNLAELYWKKDPTDAAPVEKALDDAWACLNDPCLPHDGSYAYILSKCAPSFRHFCRDMEADALEEISKEIYRERS